MTLAPQTRVLLTDALRPPAGCRVDVAVGTTYSLDLTALLLAPMAFALFDYTGDDPEKADPVRLLEAVRRHTDHTTVFCQAGGIHVPMAYPRMFPFIEASVLEVMPPAGKSVFHPKIWALRFMDQDHRFLHRFVILSRNLTFDRSWDTALVLDEAAGGAIAAAPAASFIRRLPELALRKLDLARRRQIEDLSNTLDMVWFSPPSPFTDGALLPIGIDEQQVWPFPARANRLVAISPFLTRNAVSALASVSTERTIVSRPESFDQAGADALGGWDVCVLQRLAEADPSDDVQEAERAIDEFIGTNEGLHAKTFILDLPGERSTTITGSANLTAHPWNRSVEFDAALTGPTSTCGVAAALDGAPDAPGLRALLVDYSATSAEGTMDAAIATSRTIEEFHRELALGRPTIQIAPCGTDSVRATLSMAVRTDAPGLTKLWPATLDERVHGRDLNEELVWTLAPINVTPFIAIETTAGAGDAFCKRRCVLKAELAGDVDTRRHDVLASILRSKADVLRYLAFLLGDPSYDALVAELAGATGEGFKGEFGGAPNNGIAVFEPLVRAVGRDEDALARVACLIDDIRSLRNREALVPDGFEELWDAVWQAHQEMRS